MLTNIEELLTENNEGITLQPAKFPAHCQQILTIQVTFSHCDEMVEQTFSEPYVSHWCELNNNKCVEINIHLIRISINN